MIEIKGIAAVDGSPQITAANISGRVRLNMFGSSCRDMTPESGRYIASLINRLCEQIEEAEAAKQGAAGEEEDEA